MKLLTIAIAAFILTGCATNAEYTAYVEAHKARASAETARFNALQAIASKGDTTAAVAAAMALSQAGGSNQTPIAAPVSASESALRWASILSPVITQGYIAHQNARVSIAHSNNAAATAASTNAAFVGIAGQIQAPGATTTNINSFNDSTSVPTVVQQPTPIIVDQPAPIIVEQPAVQ